MQSLTCNSRLGAHLLVGAAAIVMANAMLSTPIEAQRAAPRRFILPTASSLAPTDTVVPTLRLATPKSLTLQQQQQVLVGYQQKGWGTGFGVEGFVGRIRFDRDMLQPDQDVVGALAGLYLGASSRLRAYWWKGADTLGKIDENTSRVQSYGGEFQFGIKESWFVHPFIILGGGRLDYADDYRGSDNRPREDQNTWIVGAGLTIRALNWLEINAAFRDNLTRPPGVRDRWLNNGLVSAGLSLRFGGMPSQQSIFGSPQGPPPPTTTVVTAGAAAAGAPGTATFPVPVHGGEIKIVYNADTLKLGDSAAVARAMAMGIAIEEAMRDLVSSEMAYLNALYPIPYGTKRTSLTPEQSDSLSRRLALRTNGAYDYLLRGQAESMRAAMKMELDLRGVDSVSQVKVLARMDSVLAVRIAASEAQSLALQMQSDSAYARKVREEADADKRTVTAGIGGFNEFYVDGKVNFRSPWARELRLGPQVALGFTGTITALVTGNATYYFSTSSTKPYAGLGIGVLVRGGEIDNETGSSFVINPIFGIEFTNSSDRTRRWFGPHALGYFVEVQGVDMFGNTRLVGGVTWKF